MKTMSLRMLDRILRKFLRLSILLKHFRMWVQRTNHKVKLKAVDFEDMISFCQNEGYWRMRG